MPAPPPGGHHARALACVHPHFEARTHPRRPPVLALANHKGGCGKTTSVANIGAAFAELGHRVLLIDADPQANLSEAFGISEDLTGPRLDHALELHDAEPQPWQLDHLADTRAGAGTLDVLPCTARLEAAVMLNATTSRFERRLRAIVDALAANYDVIVIDTPPGLNPLSSMALLAADWVVIPARPADLDIGGAVKLVELIEHRLRPDHPALHVIGILLTQADRRWRLTQDAYGALAASRLQRLRHDIPFMVRAGAAPRESMPSLLLKPDSKVAWAYRRVASDLAQVLFA